MLIRDLFVDDVTRDIPPVVYFHEQSPDKLQAEVGEYIVTGGWPSDHPNHTRVPQGIHEEYLRLLTGLRQALDTPGGPTLPASWVSGFYGSGKSSFAKLLGLALDGRRLPDGTPLADAWLARDRSPRAEELRDAWTALTDGLRTIAVVFDIGGSARDEEHIHNAVLRQVQQRLGYCPEPHVANHELKLERDGHWERFEEVAQQELGSPWAMAREKAMAEDDFSLVMHRLFPDHFPDPTSWLLARAGGSTGGHSPEDVVRDIEDMLAFRAPDATLFLVVDEVSQYVLFHADRIARLQTFVENLGARLHGRVWLIALGQQKIEENAGDELHKLKDRFPKRLRVHLAPTNIRDVVHRRLLHKKPQQEAMLRQLFTQHQADLQLYAYGCDGVTAEDFVQTYPLLPGQIGLLLQITTALRTRSSRAQGDDQAIRGLLQLLGELFRDRALADREVGALVPLDEIYEVQHTALDADAQASMARILSACAADEDPLLLRVAKAVALLELIADEAPADVQQVARALYDRLDRGRNVDAVKAALETLRTRNLLGYSEKTGYRLQSSAGEEWQRERGGIGVGRERISELVMDGLRSLLGMPELPRLEGRTFRWAARFSDGRQADDAVLQDPRDPSAFVVDLRFLPQDERDEATWVRRSDESALKNRMVWVCGDRSPAEQHARELWRSQAMVRKYQARRESLTQQRKMLLLQEESQLEDLQRSLRDACAAAWMDGRIYFRGRVSLPTEVGGSFASALSTTATRLLKELYPHFCPTNVTPGELAVLLETDITGPSPKFMPAELGIIELDSGRWVPTCSGVVPRRIQEFLEGEGGISGTGLLAHFGGPPYGYATGVVKACVAGLLQASKLRIQPESGAELTAVRDAGTRDLFDRDRDFRRASFFKAGDDDVGYAVRARIRELFRTRLGQDLTPQDAAFADAVAALFPGRAEVLRTVVARLERLPPASTDTQGVGRVPPSLDRLQKALEDCLRQVRNTKTTVLRVKQHLNVLNDGLQELDLLNAELTDAALSSVRTAHDVLSIHGGQLVAVERADSAVSESMAAIRSHLDLARPWRDIVDLDPHLATLRQAYADARVHLLTAQEAQAEAARNRVKARKGFAGLDGDQQHHVLRPIADACHDTDAGAVAPPLAALDAPFVLALQRAEEEANHRLDELLSEDGDKRAIVKVSTGLRNRIVEDERGLDAVLDELRTRVTEQLRAGHRVRLL